MLKREKERTKKREKMKNKEEEREKENGIFFCYKKNRKKGRWTKFHVIIFIDFMESDLVNDLV